LAEKKDEAATKYLTQIKTGEQAAEAYFLLGKKHEEAKEFEMAIAYYDTASRLAPNSEFGISAKKHLSLLNLLQEKNTGAKNPAETHFLLGEIYGLALNDNEAALREYRITYDSFPESPYALKALYAQAWIIKNRLHREDYDTIFKTIINEYPRTIYANVARRSLGLPEIKLLPEDTASPKPLTESIPSPTGPKPESLALTKKELPTVPKESLPEITVRTPSPEAESIMQQRAPTKPRGRHRRTEIVSSETTKIANLQPPKESLPSSFKPKPESLLTSKSESVSAKNESLPQPVESTAQKEAKIKSTSPTAGKFIFLPIHFDFDRYNIRTGDAGILKTIAQQLQQDSTVKILIEGHCDPIGGEKYNYTLGLRRANSAREYLIKLGISKDRIPTISYGKDKPLTNDSSEYWKNRRCEFVIKNEPS
jgi:peptidoglycan-associated lipoprotein